jgi:hypothetical protein
MSTADFQGDVHAFKTWMQAAARDIAEGGEIKPAEPRYPRSDGRERMTWREALLARATRLRRSA